MNFIATKQAKIGSSTERVSLTKEEFNNAMEELLKINIEELKRIEKALNYKLSDSEAIKILFERQGISSFTYLSNLLDYKIENLKKEEIKKLIVG